MTETTCAGCGQHTESRWRIRLERDASGKTEATDYRLCRGCWEALRARHGEPKS